MSLGEIDKALAELNGHLTKRPKARLAFEEMSPSHKREYLKFIAEAKQPQTRQRRIEKSLDMLETWWAVKQIKKSR